MTTQNTASQPLQPLTIQEHHAIATFYAAWNNQNPDFLDEACTPDWKDIPLGPGQASGPQGLKDIIAHFTSLLPDVQIIVHEIFGSHERAGVRAEITFTHTNAILGIPPTGKKVAVAMHEFHYLKNGRLTHTWHMEDWFSLLMQSSAWPLKD